MTITELVNRIEQFVRKIVDEMQLPYLKKADAFDGDHGSLTNKGTKTHDQLEADITSINSTKADSDSVLLKGNTTEFIPDTDFDPATKKFVVDTAFTNKPLYQVANIAARDAIAEQDRGNKLILVSNYNESDPGGTTGSFAICLYVGTVFDNVNWTDMNQWKTMLMQSYRENFKSGEIVSLTPEGELTPAGGFDEFKSVFGQNAGVFNDVVV